MSYSRWGKDSHWYTYWHAGGGYDRDDQYFDVCGIKIFTYRELKDDIEACLAITKEEDIRHCEPSATNEEITELMGYMKEFMTDVEGDKDINFYEDLKIGRITPGLLEWFELKKDENLINRNKFFEGELLESVDEAFKVLYAGDNELPLLISEVQTNIGKLLIEKRLKGVVNQVKKSGL